MNTDPRGCPVGTGSANALTHSEKALWRMLSYFGNPLEDLDAASAEDPEWILPVVMKANCLLSMAEHAHTQEALKLLALAGSMASRGRGNDRERAHIAASLACASGQWRTACDLWERILVEHPRDLVALLAAHLFDFYRGDSRNLQRRVARVLPAWSAATPMYSFVLGLHAFGLEECHHYPQAQEAGLAALAMDRRDPWAVHAVAHVHEMRGEYEQGVEWLTSRRDDWAPDNGFAFHNWWHLALFNLERGDTTSALRLFDERIAPNPEMALQYVDITALLWRLKLMGVDVGDRWEQAAAVWPQQAPDAGHYAFNDFHAVLAHIGAGRVDAAEQVLAAVTDKMSESTTPGAMAATVGVPLLRGMVAYACSDFPAAVDHLLPVREQAFRFGGSNAQRDVIEQTLLDAAIRADRKPLARHLLNERLLAKRHSPLTEYWARRAA